MDSAKQSSSVDVDPPPSADELKDQGNTFVRNGNWGAALLLYSEAIKLSPKDPILYSNRSLTFLKMQMYYHAHQDAETVIQLNPSWPKGHFRKAEILAAIGHYDSSLLSYGRAIQLQPGDRNILAAAQKVAALSNQHADYEKRLPWVGAGLGIIIGVIIALSDHFLSSKPTLKHPALMVFLVMIISCFGYICARCVRYYLRIQKRGMLDPPTDLFNDEQEEENRGEAVDLETDVHPSRTRYSRAQGRMRFRKGKS